MEGFNRKKEWKLIKFFTKLLIFEENYIKEIEYATEIYNNTTF
jgi:hypothetical protein